MGIGSRLTTVRDMLKRQGIGDLARYMAHRACETYYERRFRISTGHPITLESLKILSADAVQYAPSSYPGFFRAMREVPKRGVFVDYGAGQGRIVISAATFPFDEVIGVEFSEKLAQQARANIETAQKRLRSPKVSVITGNALDFRVPDTAVVFHLYNPFRGETLTKVIAEIARSLREKPRRAWIVFAYPWTMDGLMRGGTVIPLTWQKTARDYLWPFHRDTDPNGHRYRVYALDSR